MLSIMQQLNRLRETLSLADVELKGTRPIRAVERDIIPVVVKNEDIKLCDEAITNLLVKINHLTERFIVAVSDRRGDFADRKDFVCETGRLRS